MTSRIFHNWFHEIFIKEVIQFTEKNNLPPNALLLIDNCSAHAPIEKLQSADGNIFVYFLPTNVTAAVQPMDQNPIKLTKLIYRNKLLAQLVAEGIELTKFLKQHSISNAITFLKQAWDELPQRVIRNFWSKLLNWDLDEYDIDDDLPLARLINQDCSEALERNQSLLTVIAPRNSIRIDEIQKWNEDGFVDGSSDESGSDNVASDDDDEDQQRHIPQQLKA